MYQPVFNTCKELLRVKELPIVTFSLQLDELLGGGVQPHEVRNFLNITTQCPLVIIFQLNFS